MSGSNTTGAPLKKWLRIGRVGWRDLVTALGATPGIVGSR